MEENMQRLQIPIKSSDEKSKCFELQIKTKSSMFKKRLVKTWTSQQDEKLIELHKKYPKKWNIISQHMKNRNQNQCLHRYRRICQIGQNKKIWSQYQDEVVLKMINKYGCNWKVIAQELKTKTGKQIRERFINKLDPKIRRQEWTEQQDLKIIQLYSKWGSKWCEISKCLQGRPQNRIKNRFYSYIQKNYEFSFKEKSSVSSGSQKIQQKIPEQQNKQNSPMIASYRPLLKRQSESFSLSKRSSSGVKVLEEKRGSINLSLMTEQPLSTTPKQKGVLTEVKQQEFCYAQNMNQEQNSCSGEYDKQNFEQIDINEQEKIYFNNINNEVEGSLKQINDQECYYKYNCTGRNADLLYFEDND